MTNRKKSRRYFYRVIPSSTGDAADQLPQISDVIPASRFYTWFKFSLFALILFGVLSTLLFTFILPAPPEASHSYSLIHSPSSAKGHLTYLEWLVTHYRLEDARREIGYLALAQNKKVHSDFDVANYMELTGRMRSSEEDFRKIVEEYAFWQSAHPMFPGYRDGLYRSSQLAYRLFNQAETVSKLQLTVELDPQFDQGKSVLEQIQNEDP